MRRAWVILARLLSVFAAITAFALGGCGGRSAPPANTPMERIGSWQVGVAGNPDPARVGENTMTVIARDTSGNPMPGSAEVVVSMAAMGAMPAMESRGKVKPAGRGVFRVAYGLPMGGEWDVTVRLVPNAGPPVEARYRLSTSIAGLAFAGGTPSPGAPGTGSGSSIAAPPTSDSAAGAVTIDAARRQSLGIRTERLQLRPLSATLRVPGRVAFDEARQAEVAPKFSGWVRSIAASVTGQAVRRGQVLFSVYSPELWAAQQEYLEALGAARSDQGNSSLAGSSSDIARAARVRLSLWDIAPSDIDAIARAGHPLEALPIRATGSGVITEKNVVQGSAFQAGQVLYRIAGLDPIWVVASVSQQDAPFVRTGMAATIRDPYRGGVPRRGRVAFVYPSLDSTTRTAEVRIEVRNADAALRPQTFVDVDLATPHTARLAVPESAVLPTGERSIVFVDLGDGRLAPREVRLGVRTGSYYEVVAGLRAGDVVVTSGNFLVAAESKLRSAAQKW